MGDHGFYLYLIALAVCGYYMYTRVKTVPKPCSCAENTSRLALFAFVCLH